jgi:hypothetical protein
MQEVQCFSIATMHKSSITEKYVSLSIDIFEI